MSLPRFAWICGRELGREARRGTVVDASERDAVVVDPRDRVAQREDLEAAGVGEDRRVPAHEPVQPAEVADQLVARPEVQVVGVAEQDLRAEVAHLVRVQRLHGPLRPDGHEDGRLDLPVRRPQHPGPRRPVGRLHLEDRAPGAMSRRQTRVTRLRHFVQSVQFRNRSTVCDCDGHGHVSRSRNSWSDQCDDWCNSFSTVTGSASHRRRSRSGSAPRLRGRRGAAISSTPANAITSASSVERGRWKFVSRWSTRRNVKPGVMKSSVRPASGRAATRASRARARWSCRPRARAPRAAMRCPRRRRDRVPLAVDRVLLDHLGLQRPERVEPDVQRHALDVELREQLRREVQAGCRRRRRAVLARIDRLVALGVAERLVMYGGSGTLPPGLALEPHAPAARRRDARATRPRRSARPRAASASGAQAPPTRPRRAARAAAPRRAGARSGSAPGRRACRSRPRAPRATSSGSSRKTWCCDLAGRARGRRAAGSRPAAPPGAGRSARAAGRSRAHVLSIRCGR